MTRIEAFSKLGGPSFVRDLVSLFVSGGQSTLARLRALIAANDHAVLRKEAHALKGSALNLGAVRCARAAQELEQAASANDAARWTPLLTALESELGEASAALERIARDIVPPA